MTNKKPGVISEEAADLVSDGLASVAEAMTFLGLSRSRLYELMNEGALAFVKIGHARRIPRRALVRLAADGLMGAR